MGWSGLREGSPGAVGAQGRGANPEGRKKCRQRNKQMQRQERVSCHDTPRENAAVQMAEPRVQARTVRTVGPLKGVRQGSVQLRSAFRARGVSLEAAAVTQAREKSDLKKDLGDAFETT